MPDNVICGKNHDKSSDMESAGLFVLKHKDLDSFDADKMI